MEKQHSPLHKKRKQESSQRSDERIDSKGINGNHSIISSPSSSLSLPLSSMSQSASPTKRIPIFAGCHIYLHMVGKKYLALKNIILKYGGIVTNKFTTQTTHILTCKKTIDEVINFNIIIYLIN